MISRVLDSESIHLSEGAAIYSTFKLICSTNNYCYSIYLQPQLRIPMWLHYCAILSGCVFYIICGIVYCIVLYYTVQLLLYNIISANASSHLFNIFLQPNKSHNCAKFVQHERTKQVLIYYEISLSCTCEHSRCVASEEEGCVLHQTEVRIESWPPYILLYPCNSKQNVAIYIYVPLAKPDLVTGIYLYIYVCLYNLPHSLKWFF